MRLNRGLQGLMSYALQRARDVDTGLGLVNSPSQMAKVRLSMPVASKRTFLSGELLVMGSRRTLADARLGAATTVNLTVVAPIASAFELVGSVRDLFNVQYSDPASDQHRQDSIPQNGRTLRVGLTWKLWAKP